jgi:TRAP-type mannitol/chloroaromatic compound transport system substrate-binding protein
MILLILVSIGMSGTVLAQEIRWRMATFDSETGMYYVNFAKPFAELVHELTGGQMTIEILPGGTLGSIFKLHEQVKDGLAEMGLSSPIFLGPEDPTNSMLAVFPGGLGWDSYLSWLYFGGGEQLWNEHREQTMGLHAFIAGNMPTELFAHSHTPIRTAKDLEGLKFRTLGFWAAILKEKLGGSPTVVAGGELYGMLQNKALDLGEYATPSENYRLGFHEVAKYIIYPAVHTPSSAMEVFINLDKWNSLPEDIQRKMKLAAKLVTYEGSRRVVQADMEAMQKIRAGTNEFIRLDDAFIEEVRMKAREWAEGVIAEAKAKNNPWPEKIAKSVFEYQDFWRENSGYLMLDHQK